jgi:hypothetical protein
MSLTMRVARFKPLHELVPAKLNLSRLSYFCKGSNLYSDLTKVAKLVQNFMAWQNDPKKKIQYTQIPYIELLELYGFFNLILLKFG